MPASLASIPHKRPNPMTSTSTSGSALPPNPASVKPNGTRKKSKIKSKRIVESESEAESSEEEILIKQVREMQKNVDHDKGKGEEKQRNEPGKVKDKSSKKRKAEAVSRESTPKQSPAPVPNSTNSSSQNIAPAQAIATGDARRSTEPPPKSKKRKLQKSTQASDIDELGSDEEGKGEVIESPEEIAAREKRERKERKARKARKRAKREEERKAAEEAKLAEEGIANGEEPTERQEGDGGGDNSTSPDTPMLDDSLPNPSTSTVAGEAASALAEGLPGVAPPVANEAMSTRPARGGFANSDDEGEEDVPLDATQAPVQSTSSIAAPESTAPDTSRPGVPIVPSDPTKRRLPPPPPPPRPASAIAVSPVVPDPLQNPFAMPPPSSSPPPLHYGGRDVKPFQTSPRVSPTYSPAAQDRGSPASNFAPRPRISTSTDPDPPRNGRSPELPTRSVPSRAQPDFPPSPAQSAASPDFAPTSIRGTPPPIPTAASSSTATAVDSSNPEWPLSASRLGGPAASHPKPSPIPLGHGRRSASPLTTSFSPNRASQTPTPGASSSRSQARPVEKQPHQLSRSVSAVPREEERPTGQVQEREMTKLEEGKPRHPQNGRMVFEEKDRGEMESMYRFHEDVIVEQDFAFAKVGDLMRTFEFEGVKQDWKERFATSLVDMSETCQRDRWPLRARLVFRTRTNEITPTASHKWPLLLQVVLNDQTVRGYNRLAGKPILPYQALEVSSLLNPTGSNKLTLARWPQDSLPPSLSVSIELFSISRKSSIVDLLLSYASSIRTKSPIDRAQLSSHEQHVLVRSTLRVVFPTQPLTQRFSEVSDLRGVVESSFPEGIWQCTTPDCRGSLLPHFPDGLPDLA